MKRSAVRWQQLGGLFIEEFCVVTRGTACGQRLVDAVVLSERETRVAARRSPMRLPVITV